MTALSRISSDIDLFADDALHDPYPLYTELRNLGPAAYLRRYDVYHLGRYDQVRKALADWQTFSSAQGAGFNPIINKQWEHALICVDPPIHGATRKLFTERLGPRHLQDVEDTIHQRAEALAKQLRERRDFDGVRDVAHDLPINVIFDLIGWPEEARDELAALAAGCFDACGPDSLRMRAALPRLEAMRAFVADTYDRDRLKPGGFGSTVAEAGRRGDIPREAAIGLMEGYVIAAFDTTINAISNGLWQFAQNPQQWDRLRRDPAKAAAAFLEIIRIDSPLQHLARVTTREVDLGEGVVLPAGARVVISYASANRDERHYRAPDTFDIDRHPTDHLGFGLATHNCAGQALAKLEGLAVFSALARHIDGFILTGPVQRVPNSITRGLSHLPMRAH
ncbi:cytochrome P450 [Xanthomonas maliensis]|uniref:cytochrome P450 n=1 Tax=Xanthomonas maliensis TaxID=1321368 RepID=UPI00039E282C|nr:cytochrome P450 [Xanthomonas maliensis]KAB7771143.1 cytochrome P450 [Xanthomonas maliensis]